MSNSDFKAGGDASRKPQEPAPARTADDLDTGAEELRAMLRKLGDQIAATDRRNSETLAEMQAHLSQIGGKADAAKGSQPTDPSEPGRAADDAAPVAGPPGGRHDADIDRPLFGHSDPSDEDRFAHPVPEAAPQQPMFISSSSPQPWALRSAVGLASGPDALTPFASSEPWDREAADALTRIYESGEATRSTRMDFRMPPSPRRASEPLPGAEHASPHAMGDVDRPWLEERFAEIATRIEQSMSDLRSGTAVRDLSPKFDQLEQRIIAALDLLATRVDVDGLRHVEAHVNELFTHVEHATAQLARLDGIELQLNALGDRLGDDRIVRLAAELMPTEAELTALAEVAADRAIAKLTGAQPEAAALSGAGAAGAAGDDRVASIEDLLRSSIEERRRNEEQTTAALDTLQQAMQYMIDRVQMIEHMAMQVPQSAGGPADAALSEAPAIVEDPSPAYSDGVAPAVIAEERALAPSHLEAPLRVPPHGGEADRTPPAADWSPLPTRPEDLTPPTAGEAPPDGHEEAAPPQSQPATLASEQVAPMSRDDFIAAARRAARKASGQPTRDLPAAPPPPPAGSSMQGAARLWQDAKGRLGSPSALLTAACVGAALLVGGGVMYATSFRPMAIFAKSERRALPVEIEAPRKEGKGAGLTPASPADALKRSSAALGASSLESSAAVATPPSPSASNPASLGIMLQTGAATMTAEQLAEIRRQQQVAAMSQQLARLQAEETAKAAAPLPTVLTAAAAPPPAPVAAKADAPAASSMPKLPMPPAAIGPNSLRVAAANGDASAQFEVAARFAEGRGIKQDFKQALVWYQRSAAQSFVPAQYRLATLYERGLGGDADPARALLWYKRAAEGGSVKAMHNLAAMSANRPDTAPDYATAARWFTSAAERGLADSQYNLGILAESGLGMDRDLAAAYKWFALAARQGDKDAVKRRDALKVHLSLEQLRKADQELSTWKAEAADAHINDDRMAGESWKARATEAG